MLSGEVAVPWFTKVNRTCNPLKQGLIPVLSSFSCRGIIPASGDEGQVLRNRICEPRQIREEAAVNR